MATTRSRRQILTSERKNRKNFITLTDGVDLSDYKNNPVLLLEHEKNGQPIGKVVNIKKEGDKYLGDLVFAPTSRGKEAEVLYNEGFYNTVSIAGDFYMTEKAGERYSVKTLVKEISLVSVPANPDAYAINSSGEQLNIIYKPINEIWQHQLSSSDEQLINNYIMNNEETKQPDVESQELSATEGVKEVKKALGEVALGDRSQENRFEDHAEGEGSPDAETGRMRIIQNVIDFARDGLRLTRRKEGKSVEDSLANKEDKKEESKLDDVELKEKMGEEEKLNHDVIQPGADPFKVHLSDSSSEDAKLFDTSKDFNKIEVKNMNLKPAALMLSSEEGSKYLSLGSSIMNECLHDEKAITRPENYNKLEAIRAIAVTLANDKNAMNFLKTTNTKVNDGFSQPVTKTIQELASGANSVNFVNNTPDLAKVIWTSLFYRHLFENNRFLARTQKVSGFDKQGIIWVESGLTPEIYFGNRAPLNQASMTYDDVARGLATHVFSSKPITWQSANTDILAYNDVNYGLSELFRWFESCLSNYATVVLGSEASEVVRMTGVGVESANWFQRINPNAAGIISTIDVHDLNMLAARYVNDNYDIQRDSITLVVDGLYGGFLKGDERFINALNKPGGVVDPSYQEWDAFRIYSRSRTTLYDTAANATVDPMDYYQGTVNQQTGAVTAVTPPVLNATTYGAPLSFIPSQVVEAFGNINVHFVVDPSNYGWTTSVDIRYGVGSARTNGTGIRLLAPEVATTAGVPSTPVRVVEPIPTVTP